MTAIETDNALSVTRVSTKKVSEILDLVRTLEGDLYYLNIHFNISMKMFNGALVFKPGMVIKRKK